MLPNFLIAGMAKCGTSSLSQYLQQHPDIFISEKKEPRFLSSQCMSMPLGGPKDAEVEDWYVKGFEDYERLFEQASEQAIGEASADTLYFYEGTIPVIKKYLGNPKIIIILRDPVKRAFSAYQHLIRDDRETRSFKESLEQEEQRIKENYELIYHYKKASEYYEPIKAFQDSFDHVKVVLSEDLSKEPNGVLTELFQFLDVEPSFRIESQLMHNVSGKPKSRLLHQTLQGDNALRKMIRPVARTILPSKEARIRVTNKIFNKNLDRMSIDPQMSKELYSYFSGDIKKTAELINKDLSHWTFK